MSTLSESPVYMLASLAVQDPVEYRIYERGFFPILKRHGGEFITYDDAPQTLEGAAPPPGRLVIFKFPSERQARDWYADPEYQALCVHRRSSTALQFLTLVHMPAPRA